MVWCGMLRTEFGGPLCAKKSRATFWPQWRLQGGAGGGGTATPKMTLATPQPESFLEW